MTIEAYNYIELLLEQLYSSLHTHRHTHTHKLPYTLLAHAHRGIINHCVCVGAEAFGRAMFGEGEGFILLNGVNCTGNEERLENCGSSDYVAHNCTHGEDAGVRCMALRGM